MIKPLALFIGLRYTRAKRRSWFVSIISLLSIISFAISVMVMITVLSVMNGFDYQIRSRFFALVPQVTIMTGQSIANTWQKLSKEVKQIPSVTHVAPYVTGKGLLMESNQVNGVEVMGILPKEEQKVSQLGSKMVRGHLASLVPGRFNLIIGKTLANRLGLQVGDKINLFTPQTLVTLAGVFPRYRAFTISGVFHTTSGFGFDNSYVYINMQDAAKLFPPGKGVRGLHVQLNNIYQASAVTQQLQNSLPQGFAVTNWTEQFGAFFQALKMEKTVLFWLLFFIMLIAAISLISILILIVNDKRADIAILRTLGMSPGAIMSTFVIQGVMIGLLGTFFGLLAGILLSLSITDISNALQNIFHIQFVSAKIFFIDYVPSRIEVLDVLKVCLVAIALSLLATILPALRAFSIQPAEALRYE